MNSEAFQIELDQIDISKSFDTVPAELIQLAKVAQQSGTQSATMKENITSKIFDALIGSREMFHLVASRQ